MSQCALAKYVVAEAPGDAEAGRRSRSSCSSSGSQRGSRSSAALGVETQALFPTLNRSAGGRATGCASAGSSLTTVFAVYADRPEADDPLAALTVGERPDPDVPAEG